MANLYTIIYRKIVSIDCKVKLISKQIYAGISIQDPGLLRVLKPGVNHNELAKNG